jgi:hypothetical protein
VATAPVADARSLVVMERPAAAKAVVTRKAATARAAVVRVDGAE